MNIETAVTKYFTMWNEHDPAARLKVIRELWTHDAVSADPLSSVTGHDAIDAMVAGVQANMPPHRFELVGDIAAHNDRVLYYWRMIADDSSVMAAGLDAVRVTGDGQFADLAGFFGPTP
jgi:hypothetical protein